MDMEFFISSDDHKDHVIKVGQRNYDMMFNRMKIRAGLTDKPQVGDFVVLEKEHTAPVIKRVAHIWDFEGGGIQTGGVSGYHLASSGNCSYSGGLDSVIPFEKFEKTTDTKDGYVWSFRDDCARAHNGVHCAFKFNVFKVRL